MGLEGFVPPALPPPPNFFFTLKKSIFKGWVLGFNFTLLKCP